MNHEELWGLDQGMREPYPAFSPVERTIVDFRLHLPKNDKSHLVMQLGLPDIQPDIVSSPFATNRATREDEERLEAVKLEIKRSLRIRELK